MAQKGISLPIEMIIIIAIAVLVLVVLAALFLGGVGPPFEKIKDEAALRDGCTKLSITFNCDYRDLNTIIIAGYRPAGVTIDQSLEDACVRLRYAVPGQCREVCGCPQ